MKNTPIVLVFYALLSFAVAQAKESPAYSLASPYATIVTHLGFLEEGNYHPEIAAKAFCPQYVAEEEAEKLAIKLKEILDKELVQIDIEKVPQDKDCIDPIAKYHRYQLTKKLPQVYLIRLQGQWVYSQETVQYIIHFQQSTWRKLSYLFPQLFRSQSFLGLYPWQYITIVSIIALFWLIYRLIIALIRKLLHVRLMQWIPNDARCIEKLLMLVSIGCLGMLTLPVVQLPIVIEKYATRLLKGFLIIVGTVLCYRLVNLLVIYIEQKMAARPTKFNLRLLPFYSKCLKVLVVIIGTFIILYSFHFDIATLLAGVSIGGLGFALASQDTIKNLFGSLMILIDKPFSVGDSIVTGAIEGKVEEIGFRSTRIRTVQESLMYIPNAKLADTHIDNYSLRKLRRFSTVIAIDNNLPIHLIETLLTGLRTIVAHYSYISKKKHYVYLNDIGEAKLEVLFCVYFKVDSRVQELQCKHEVIMAILKLASALGIRFWLPIHTLHMASFPEKKPCTPGYATDPIVLDKKLQAFLQQEKMHAP